MMIGLFSVQPYYGYITPFVSSLLVLFSLFTSLTAIIVNVRYGEYQFKKSFVPQTTKGWTAKFISAVDFVIPWLLWLIAVIVTACGLWFFGRNNLPSYLVSDITFIVVLLLGIIGILALPFAAGADLLCGSPRLVKVCWQVFDWRLASHPAIARSLLAYPQWQLCYVGHGRTSSLRTHSRPASFETK